MARSKVKLAFIDDAAKRKVTNKKRRKGFFNKVSELSTLCGINICAILYCLDDPEPVVWPDTFGVQHMISKFMSMTKMEQTVRMFDQEAFLKDRIAKVQKKLEKLLLENHEKELNELLFVILSTGKTSLENLTLQNLSDIEKKGEEKLNEINKRMAAMKIAEAQEEPAVPPPTPCPVQPSAPTLTNDQMQLNSPEWYCNWINDRPGEDELVRPLTDDSTTAWLNTSCNPNV